MTNNVQELVTAATDHAVKEINRISAARDAAIQEAQIWKQEAITQRETVIAICRAVGAKPNDWEAPASVIAEFERISARLKRYEEALIHVRTRCVAMWIKDYIDEVIDA